jgi:two-component system sensor histidine kinase/response regulator
MRFRTSIQQKILLLLLGLALPPLILVGSLGLAGLARARTTVVEEGQQALRLQTERALERRATDKAQVYDLALAAVQQQVTSVANYAAVLYAQERRPVTDERVWIPPAPSPELLAANAGGVAYAQQLIPVLRSAVSANPLVNIGYVALDDGGVIAFDNDDVIDVLLTIQPFDPRTRPWYLAAREQGGPIWVDTYVDANTGLLATTCAAPLYDENGTFFGVVAFDLLLETIQNDLLMVDIGPEGYAMLLNESGEVIFRPNLEPMDTQWDQPFASENLAASSDQGLRTVAAAMMAREAGITRIAGSGPASAESGSYIAYAPIPTARWSVALVVPVNDVVRPALDTGRRIGESQDQLRNQMLALLLLIGSAIAVLGILLSLSFTNRIRALQASVQAVAGGDLNQRLPAAGRDEIGQLVDAFNSMTGALQENVAELEANAEQLATLNTVSNELKRILDLRKLQQAIPAAVCERFGFDRAALYLISDGLLKVVATSFGSGDRNEAQARHFMEVANSAPLPVDGASIEADVVRSGKAIIVDNPWEHPNVEPRKQAASASSAYVQVPIFGRERRVIGLLSADYNITQRPIVAHDASRLLMFASMVGLTLENVQIYSDLERQVASRTEELRAALAQAQLADRRKSDFLASVSHELRTPLNAIIGFSTVLLDALDGPLSTTQHEDVQSIHRNGRFLLHLINELLDLAKIEAGHLSLDLGPVDLRRLVIDTVDTVQGVVRSRSVILQYNLPPTLPLALADADRVRQVLLNLLSNAVKFTERGTITVSAGEIDEIDQQGKICRVLMVRVADTGIGIPPERQAEIFQEFVQIHGKRSRVNGTGLGLAIARKLVEAQRGRIWVESAPGVGSIFSFTLPLLGDMDQGTGHSEPDAEAGTPSALLETNGRTMTQRPGSLV